MVFNLNIVDLILLLHHEINHFIYKKKYFNKKLSTIPLHIKFILQELQN